MTVAKTLLVMLIGVLLWLFATLLIRFAGPEGVFAGGEPTVMFYAVTPVFVFGALVGIYAGLKIENESRLSAAALISATALLLDGVAFRWFTPIYGAGDAVFGGSAWLLWAVGWTLVVGLIMRRTIVI